MFDYARSDTHFLLFVYDNLRNELIDKSNLAGSNDCLVEVVQSHSKAEALQRYERPMYDFERGSGSSGWYSLLYRTPALLNREQFAIFRAVHQWRDSVAREEDESVHMVMPKHVLFNIAREMPVDMPSLLGCSHPVSTFLQKRKTGLLSIIKNAKTTGATGPDMRHLMEEIDPDLAAKITPKAIAHSPQIAEAETRGLTSDEGSQNALPLRLQDSRFWGRHGLSRTIVDLTMEALNFRLALPLPQLTAEVFQQHLATSQVSQNDLQLHSSSLREPNTILPTVTARSELFTVRDGACFQKRRIIDESREQDITSDERGEGDADRSMQWSLGESTEQVETTRKRQKQNTTNAKHRNAVDATGETADDLNRSKEHFDYKNAPTILNKNANASSEGSKGVYPYIKSMDAPKGARKSSSKSEVAGRSHTFRG